MGKNNGNAVSYEEVVKAIEQLKADGETPTSSKIRNITKKGSYSTIGRMLKQYLKETRVSAKLNLRLSESFYTAAQTELSRQLDAYDQQCNELAETESKSINEFLDHIEEMEAQIGALEEKLSELQKVVQNKESQLQELAVSSAQKLSSADKRLEEMAQERNTALKEKTDAVREADKGKVLIDRMKEDEAKYNAQLAATASEVRELRENADQLRNAAIAAETEVKGRDNIITDLAAREKDAISRLEHLAHELQSEKEKTVKLSVELEAMKQRVSVYEAAEQKLLPKKKRSKSSSPTGQAGPPLFNEVEGPPAT